eukprot:3285140-Rhodomonas_salina.1
MEGEGVAALSRQLRPRRLPLHVTTPRDSPTYPQDRTCAGTCREQDFKLRASGVPGPGRGGQRQRRAAAGAPRSSPARARAHPPPRTASTVCSASRGEEGGGRRRWRMKGSREKSGE